MSTKPEMSEVVVENLRAAVYASHEEISVQVQADGGLDSKLLGTAVAELRSGTMPFMNTKPPPLPPPSDVPRTEIPTGAGGTLGLWTLLRKLLHR